ncbi:MAG: hypothetical protein K1X72_21980 [Pyrinomonadaceae bacterium]|nr:hypothetical protein [Pyrinomonadaceae bacterium]
MKNLYLLFILASLLIFSGCDSTATVESNKVSSSEIYQNYSITARKNQTNISATFRVGGASGTTVDLDSPAKIIHNGNEMNESKPGFLKGTNYQDSVNEFVPTHKFVYTDAKGKTWQNEITMQGLEIASNEISFSKAKGGKIILSRPVGKDEIVEFTIISDQTAPEVSKNKSKKRLPEKVYSTRLQVKFDTAHSSVIIAPNSLRNFADGTAQLHLNLRKSKNLQQSAKGGIIDFTYEAEQVAVNIGK